MGMSTYVCGVVPADDKFNKMKAIWDMCEAQKITPPQEVIDFFDGEAPDPAGLVVYLDEGKQGIIEYYNDSQSGFEVDISKLDPKFKIIRFVNSW